MNVSPGKKPGASAPGPERLSMFCNKCSSAGRATCTGYRQFATISLACSCQCHNAAVVVEWPASEAADMRFLRESLDRIIDHYNKERERRLNAEREEVLTRRVAEFAWSITASWGDRRSVETAQGILATMRLEKHNSLTRVVAAARALAAGDASAAAELRLAVAALDADPQMDLPSPASGPLPDIPAAEAHAVSAMRLGTTRLDGCGATRYTLEPADAEVSCPPR